MITIHLCTIPTQTNGNFMVEDPSLTSEDRDQIVR